ncbi:MAG: sulfite exporter TauE/SafE family protein [Crocinitomicaceae bacterium]|jgi:uncharacterized protein|nr:sulfite exporter TauE/SafE family protein [Crocinitomicaceae bacterium]
MDISFLFLLLIPIVAFMYSAVGHGGASGYLALMALFSFSPEVMKPTALMLNLIVAGLSFYHYWRKGHFNFKLFIVFSIGSIPLSFVGGLIEVDTRLYKIVLGLLLIFAVLRILNVFGRESEKTKEVPWVSGLIFGASIGFLSGLIGIGGGIILSPLILLMHWGKMKEAAAVSALFIWVNSAAGMMGQLVKGVEFDNHIWLYILLAICGGFLGGLSGSARMKNSNLKFLLAFVLILASIKLIFVS